MLDLHYREDLSCIRHKNGIEAKNATCPRHRCLRGSVDSMCL